MKRVAFTIVLNGMPFIEQQYNIIPEVFDTWYIVEGATKPSHDTSWCRNIDNSFYDEKGLSVDGTTEFLNSIASDKIKIIRKNELWNGKLEMCNSFMSQVENSILMQIDVDEFWDVDTLKDIFNFTEENNHFDGMMFRCNYFVGPDLVLKGKNCYGDMSYEWCRLWKVNDTTQWHSHEPPRVKRLNKFLTKDFTEGKGWKFDHHAYVIEEQLKFKENFYGYVGAFNNWMRLQNNEIFPVMLKEYFPWVKDNVLVEKINEGDKRMKENIKLNLGCAKDIKPGYLNIDLYDHPQVKKCDVRDLSFLDNNSVDEIFAKDIIEHMSFSDVKKAIKEWVRVLKPNGIIFIQTINIEKQIEAFKNGVWSIEDFNHMVFAGVNWVGEDPKCEDFHKCAFTKELLTRLLSENGVVVTDIREDQIDGALKVSPRSHNLNVMMTGKKEKKNYED